MCTNQNINRSNLGNDTLSKHFPLSKNLFGKKKEMIVVKYFFVFVIFGVTKGKAVAPDSVKGILEKTRE